MPFIIDLVYINAGGGHRASALALEAIALQQQRPWQLRLINLFDVLDPGQRFQGLTGLRPEDLYNKRLAHGWTRGMGQELRLLQQLIRLAQGRLVQRLATHWGQTRPDLVVSLVPNFNRAMFEGLRATGSEAPYVTILTDFADLEREHFWIEAGQAQHVICGTARAAEQAMARGYRAPWLHRSSGMMVRPEFYAAPREDRASAMRRHGLDPQRPTAVVMFGGHGARTMLGLAQRLPTLQLILLCGHNQALAEALRAQPAQAPRLVQGFTRDIPEFMRMADFFIGKPGPGSISEALCCGLPVLLQHNGATMPQERYNAEWVAEQGLGMTFASNRGVAAAADAMLAALPTLRQRVAAIHNRALFEVPDILDDILHSTPVAATRHQAESAAMH
ncbi:galactosyldiacylglycerol synthase [Corticibacter populi]|uniref:Galactosyldiacylglycerol synthase n=1 Tax=Corticibacter populi TaxID=1550736 RepID=A0A3M6QYQ4_9BURK|nr:glycosyltransferase [Corticibacter populi]RMX08023.1 galactosyldiacylglycerol synthase [Corticibacter populi]RZS35267.1 glycosyl transferase family 28 [Corticibacter populi]